MEFAEGTCLDDSGENGSAAAGFYSVEVGNEESTATSYPNPSCKLKPDGDDWPESPRSNNASQKYHRRSLMGTYGRHAHTTISLFPMPCLQHHLNYHLLIVRYQLATAHSAILYSTQIFPNVNKQLLLSPDRRSVSYLK